MPSPHAVVFAAVFTTLVLTQATPSSNAPAERAQGFLYGRVTAVDGTVYEGRLRFGGNEEAFWGDYFNAYKETNAWVAQVPDGQLGLRPPLRIFGMTIPLGKSEADFVRPFMARFGDIARIDPRGGDLQITLKSGTVFHLDRSGADDLADGIRVWDVSRGAVDLDEWRIQSIEFLPTGRVNAAPVRLHGTVRTRSGEFTGFIQWNRHAGVGTDELAGRGADGAVRLRFETIRAIARPASDRIAVTLHDGRQIVLFDNGNDHAERGIYVDDRRYGRVLVSWEAFERLELSAAGSGPAYGDFPRGLPLTGTVTTRTGNRLTGRLVYDLDESETTETLDAPSKGINYNIPFGLVASIALGGPGAARATVTLHDGEKLPLERSGDLADGNTGMLVFVAGRDRPEFVRWSEVAEIRFDRPPAMYPARSATLTRDRPPH